MIELDIDLPDGAPGVAVLLHPHPDMGGDRHNHVIGALYLGLPRAGFGAACFDFSSSDLAEARTDTVAAIDAVASAAPAAHIAIVGYSFGAMVATQVTDDRVAGWFLVAPPLAHVPATTIGNDPRPKAIAVAEHDAYTSPAQVDEITATWTSTPRDVIPGADHFLVGSTTYVVDAVTARLAGNYGTR
jgi:alpha/beta superfamily hydrolase